MTDIGVSGSRAPWRLATELAVGAFATAAVALLVGSMLIAIGTGSRAGSAADTTTRLHLLANAANPLTAALALLAVVGAIAIRPSRVSAPSIAASAAVSLVIALLVVNGLLLDVTTGTSQGWSRIGTVLIRLGTLPLSAATLWLWFAATGREGVVVPGVEEAGTRESRDTEIGTAITIEREPDTEPAEASEPFESELPEVAPTPAPSVPGAPEPSPTPAWQRPAETPTSSPTPAPPTTPYTQARPEPDESTSLGDPTEPNAPRDPSDPSLPG